MNILRKAGDGQLKTKLWGLWLSGAAFVVFSVAYMVFELISYLAKHAVNGTFLAFNWIGREGTEAAISTKAWLVGIAPELDFSQTAGNWLIDIAGWFQSVGVSLAGYNNQIMTQPETPTWIIAGIAVIGYLALEFVSFTRDTMRYLDGYVPDEEDLAEDVSPEESPVEDTPEPDYQEELPVAEVDEEIAPSVEPQEDPVPIEQVQVVDPAEHEESPEEAQKEEVEEEDFDISPEELQEALAEGEGQEFDWDEDDLDDLPEPKEESSLAQDRARDVDEEIAASGEVPKLSQESSEALTSILSDFESQLSDDITEKQEKTQKQENGETL